MAIAELTQQYSKRTQQSQTIPLCAIDMKSVWINASTQTDFGNFVLRPLESAFRRAALKRLGEIKQEDTDGDDCITEKVYRNGKIVFDLLDKYLEYLDEDDIDPSSSGTLLLHFEDSTEYINLEIGENTIAHVCSDQAEKFLSSSSDFDNENYWTELLRLFAGSFDR